MLIIIIIISLYFNKAYRWSSTVLYWLYIKNVINRCTRDENGREIFPLRTEGKRDLQNLCKFYLTSRRDLLNETNMWIKIRRIISTRIIIKNFCRKKILPSSIFTPLMPFNSSLHFRLESPCIFRVSYNTICIVSFNFSHHTQYLRTIVDEQFGFVYITMSYSYVGDRVCVSGWM